MECLSCGAGLGERQAFCSQCGAPAPRACPACGAPNAAEARFCGQCGTALSAIPAAPAPGMQPLERRQLTVMFCDLVGSTALALRLELEDLHDAITAYQNRVDALVRGHAGYVARHLGDGVLVFFGYPTAQEDDAERAVRAALAIVEDVPALPASRDEPLQVRIGIATGTVVIGAFMSSGAGQQPDVIGEAPNVAARLQTIAQPNTLVISDTTRRLLGDLFELRDLGRIALKGFSEEVQVWQVLRPRLVRSRFAALRQTASLPLVGREAELTELACLWRDATEGAGRIALLTGEPGIGKSRILEALRRRLNGEATFSASFSCTPQGRNSTLDPFVPHLREMAGLHAAENGEDPFARLAAWLRGRLSAPAAALPLLADLLSVPSPESVPESLSPQRRKEILLEAILELVAGPAHGDGPRLLLFEDLHWADPTTLDLLALLVRRARFAPILLAATARPEFTAPWLREAHVRVMPVSRLGRAENEALIQNIAGGKPLPREVIDLILARTDGVPLFVEELTKATLESGLLREEADGYRLVGSFSSRDIPVTLHDSLMARIDRLGEARAVAQLGAAIGRTFSFRLLSAVTEMSDPELGSALSRLADAALVLCEREPPDAQYTFRHALVQDVAYGSLLRRDRVRLHARIARTLEQLHPELRDLQPELFAQHYEAGGMAEEAVECWLLAGERARRRSALREAVAHLTQGLNALAAVPPSEKRDRQELDIRVALGIAHMSLGGYAAGEVEAALGPAHGLARALGEDLRLISLLRVLWQYHATRGDEAAASRLVAEMQQTATRNPDPVIATNASYAACAATFWRGEFDAAGAHARTLRGYELQGQTHFAAISTSDPNTSTLNCWESYRLWIQGFPDQAAETAREQVAHARQLRYPFNLCFTLTVGAAVHGFRRDPAALLACTEEAAVIAREQRIPFVEAVLAPLFGAPALIERGEAEAALAQLQAGLARWRMSGGRLMGPIHLANLIHAQLALGRHAEGLATAEEALMQVAETNERWCESELWRLKAALLHAKGDASGATAAYERALEIARAQHAPAWELRAAQGLAALWHERGESGRARALLAPALAGVREGRDTGDLRDARALLAALSSADGQG